MSEPPTVIECQYCAKRVPEQFASPVLKATGFCLMCDARGYGKPAVEPTKSPEVGHPEFLKLLDEMRALHVKKTEAEKELLALANRLLEKIAN